MNAEELKLDGFVDERSPVLIATFVDGFAAGWAFAVPESFKEALDIRLTERAFRKQVQMTWTQGRNFCFRKGDVLYDSPRAHEGAWGDAVPHVRLAVLVEEAMPTMVVTSKEWKTAGAVDVLEDGKPKDVPHRITYVRRRMAYGRVRFALLSPDATRTRMEARGEYETDQEGFVAFLQCGSVQTLDGRRHDLLGAGH